jgi:hypothetical protein
MQIDANETYIEDNSTKNRHGVQAEAASRAKKRETLPVDTAVTDLFNGIVQRMKDGGGVSFDIDVEKEDEEIPAITLERRDDEEGNNNKSENEGELV